MYDVLKPGGDCLISFLSWNPIFDVYVTLSKHPTWKQYSNDYDKFITPYQFSDNTVSQLRSIVESCNFSDVNVEEKDRLFVFPNLEIFKGEFYNPSDWRQSL